MRTDRTIIFLHMFKAYGTTLTARIRHSYTDNEHAIFNCNLEHPRNPVNMPQAKLITGHHLFGIHQQLERRYTYITLLRDPIQRLLSTYHYYREDRCIGYYLHEYCKSVSFEEFVKSTLLIARTQVDNFQTRELIGKGDVQYNRYIPDQESLEQAKQNVLTHFSFIDTTDNFESAWKQMQIKFNWKDYDIHNTQLNQTIIKPETPISHELDCYIRQRNNLDYQLIDWINIHKEHINNAHLS